jgi:hypothetical protein
MEDVNEMLEHCRQRATGSCLGVALVVMMLSACDLGSLEVSGGPIEGRVTMGDTGKPLSGAIVYVQWIGSLAHGSTCYHAATATTDSDGLYSIPAWKKPSPYGKLRSPFTRFRVFKAGMTEAENQFGESRRLELFKGSRQERLAYLQQAMQRTMCGPASDQTVQRAALPARKAIYDEAMLIAQTEDEKRTARLLVYYVEEVEFGLEEAERRSSERARTTPRETIILRP